MLQAGCNSTRFKAYNLAAREPTLIVVTWRVLLIIIGNTVCQRSRDSSVGIATGYGLDDQGEPEFEPDRVNNVRFSISSRPLWGPPNLLSNGYWGLFPGG
jgi:hypothetical protein